MSLSTYVLVELPVVYVVVIPPLTAVEVSPLRLYELVVPPITVVETFPPDIAYLVTNGGSSDEVKEADVVEDALLDDRTSMNVVVMSVKPAGGVNAADKDPVEEVGIVVGKLALGDGLLEASLDVTVATSGKAVRVTLPAYSGTEPCKA